MTSEVHASCQRQSYTHRVHPTPYTLA